MDERKSCALMPCDPPIHRVTSPAPPNRMNRSAVLPSSFCSTLPEVSTASSTRACNDCSSVELSFSKPRRDAVTPSRGLRRFVASTDALCCPSESATKEKGAEKDETAMLINVCAT